MRTVHIQFLMDFLSSRNIVILNKRNKQKRKHGKKKLLRVIIGADFFYAWMYKRKKKSRKTKRTKYRFLQISTAEEIL